KAERGHAPELDHLGAGLHQKDAQHQAPPVRLRNASSRSAPRTSRFAMSTLRRNSSRSTACGSLVIRVTRWSETSDALTGSPLSASPFSGTALVKVILLPATRDLISWGLPSAMSLPLSI